MQTADPDRVVIVVPRHETRLHEYLSRSMASVKNVEVVLDRRAAVSTPPDERRGRSSRNSERRILICSLVRCPAEPPARPLAGPTALERPRTLLWPGLRIEHL